MEGSRPAAVITILVELLEVELDDAVGSSRGVDTGIGAAQIDDREEARGPHPLAILLDRLKHYSVEVLDRLATVGGPSAGYSEDPGTRPKAAVRDLGIEPAQQRRQREPEELFRGRQLRLARSGRQGDVRGARHRPFDRVGPSNDVGVWTLSQEPAEVGGERSTHAHQVADVHRRDRRPQLGRSLLDAVCWIRRPFADPLDEVVGACWVHGSVI